MTRNEKRVLVGNFFAWLTQIRQTLFSHEGMEVPCDDCRACCTSSYFIHISLKETRTLAKIPKELLFPAPGRPKGHVLMGYDEKGHCPMFVDGNCSIYEIRPRTCRDYDCRIFPATGLSEGRDKALINERAHMWQFDFPTKQDRNYQTAIKSAAKFLSKYPELFPNGFVPKNPTQLAVLAIKVCTVFLEEPSFSFERDDQAKKVSQRILLAKKAAEHHI